MARKPRQEQAGAIHHVFARGNRRQLIYLDEADYAIYLTLLARVVARQGWLCLAYCLMENHVHLLIETPEPNLGSGMQRLHGDYAQGFNRRHRRVGHLFQGRYGAVPVTSDHQLVAVVRYIAANPVEAALCERAEEWRWSSFRAVLHRRAASWVAVARLFEYLEADGGDAYRRYADLVGEPKGV